MNDSPEYQMQKLRLAVIRSKLESGSAVYDTKEFLKASGCTTLEEVADSPVTYEMFMACLPAMKVKTVYAMPDILRKATYAKASMHALLTCKDMADD